MTKDTAVLRARDRVISLERTRIMGILNCTPDSFSDGGKYTDVKSAVDHALEMRGGGADIIDIGGQSTRPGHVKIPADEEWLRISGIIKLLAAEDMILSVDTFYPEVALRALEAGAHIINDISGFPDEMLESVKGSGCGCIVMHPSGSVSGDIIREVRAYFAGRRAAAERMGISQDRLCFDPGIGFGKSYEENLRLIADVRETKIPGSAYMMAASRKRFIGEAGGNPPADKRMSGTIAAHTIAVMGGADILRVHDVAEAVQAARVTDAILKTAGSD